MIKALLLDLDGTLLKNDLMTFTPVYFQALAAAVAGEAESEPFLNALGAGIQAMMANDGTQSNHAAFWAAAEPKLPAPRATLEPLLTAFYEDGFGTLSHVTEPVAGAPELVASARSAGLKLAVATNPMMPRRAIEHRLEWAGLSPDDFDLITCYETMHATKPHPAYFRQALGLLGVAAPDALMAGNHLSDDLRGAQAVGMKTFFVDTFGIEDAKLTPDARGSLDDLRRYLFGEG